MSVADTRAKAAKKKPAEGDSRGPLFEMLSKLLAERRDDHVVKLFAQVMARNGELEKRRAKRRLGGDNDAEGITSAQRDLFLQALKEETDAALQDANEKLKNAAKGHEKPPAPPKPPRQLALRRPIPDNLRRVENIITFFRRCADPRNRCASREPRPWACGCGGMPRKPGPRRPAAARRPAVVAGVRSWGVRYGE